MAAGQRPINNVVDITNYVMLLVGSPIHAFDLDRVAGGRLVVRRAKDGEQVTTLDGQVRTLDAQMLVIDDAEGPTSIAGVMGGERSEVHEGTTRVLMEAANWDGPNIHRTSQVLGLRSEASGRFEKGLAPEQALQAEIVATRLMLELTGARLVPGTIDVGGDGPPPAVIRLREHRVQEILGLPIPRPRQAEILRALEFAVEEAPGGLEVLVPAFRRNDVTREADLIEEVARMDGLEKLPATLPKRRGSSGRLSTEQRLRRRAHRRARRARHVRDRGLELHRARAGRPPAPGARRSPPALRRAAEPDERGPQRAAHDARRVAAGRRAPQRRARAPRPRALRGRHRLPRPGREAPARAPRAGRRARRAPAPADVGHRRARARRLLLRQGPARRRARRRPRARGRSSPRRSRSCIPGAARACSPAARTSAGSASCTRSSRARGTSTTAPRCSRSTSTACSRTATRCRATSTSRASPSCAWTSRWSLAEDVPVALVLSDRAPGGRRAAGRRARLRPLPRRAGGGGAQVAGARARLPRGRPHADRRGRRARRASASSSALREHLGGELRA